MPAPPELINDSAIPNAAFAQLHRQVEALAQADIPLWDFTIHIYVDVDRFLEDCKAPAAEGIGFTNAVSKIWILAAEDIPLSDVAAAVAHQLGHVHFEQGAKDPDWGHSRVEWFGEGGVVEQVGMMVAEGAR
jgi:hypothetical protein